MRRLKTNTSSWHNKGVSSLGYFELAPVTGIYPAPWHFTYPLTSCLTQFF